MSMFGTDAFCDFDFTCFERHKLSMPRKFLAFTRRYVKLSENSNLWQERANYKKISKKMQNFNIWFGKFFHILNLLFLNVNDKNANFFL